VGFARYPFMNCNIGHPNTKESFFGEPYQLIDINGMRLAYVSGYAGEFDAGDDDFFGVTDITVSLRRTLRYIYDNKDPDYVIVAISDWDESMQEVVNSLEGRSEERRVGKERRSRWPPLHYQQKKIQDN